MDCKEALKETDGDIENAIDYLRKKGISKAAKKSGRETSEGVVASYIHGDGRIGVMIEVNCETDFVARNDVFGELVKDLAMHIAAISPDVISPEDIPEEEVAREKNVLTEEAKNSGKPEKVIEKIVTGRLEKFFEEKCLIRQKFVKDTDKTIDELLKGKISELGENISIRRFMRYQLGESQ
jgi:elongation factor Ts